MTETTQEERDQIIQRLAESDINVSDEVCGLICDAVQDADRLAAIERQVRDMLDEMAGWNMNPGELKDAVYARLRAIIDLPDHP